MHEKAHLINISGLDKLLFCLEGVVVKGHYHYFRRIVAAPKRINK